MSRGTGSIRRAYVQLPEGQIHYRTVGEGPPLLLLHLTSFSSDVYTKVMPILAARYRVIAMDRFGHGGSDPPPEGVTVEALAKTVVNFLDSLGVERTSIVGQHTGAYEAIEVALAHPQRVNKLVLVACPDWNEEERVERLARRGADPEMDGSHIMDVWQFRREFIAPSTTQEILHRAVMAALASMGTSVSILHAMTRHHIGERLPMLQAPTLFMAGEHDHQGGHVDRHMSAMADTTPVEKSVIPGGGDFVALEKPEEYARLVMDFLAKP